MQDDLIRQILVAFDKAGLWEDGLELIGSWCFLMYQKHLGVKVVPIKTVDVDFLIPRPFLSRKVRDLDPVLKSLGFDRRFNPDGSAYFQHPELKLEFLTPEVGRGQDEPLRVNQLALTPISLRFLNMLFDHPIRVTEGGVTINLPHPKDYALHKLIIGRRRKNPAKKLKDIQHAVAVLRILDLKDTLETIAAYPPKWRAWIKDSLRQARKELPESIDIIDRFLEPLGKPEPPRDR